jgi:quercetin dioxygenase-like cupin family protein
MRVTIFDLDDGTVVPDVTPYPSWSSFEDYDGEPLTKVERVDLPPLPGAEAQLVHIAAGGHFVMHTSPDLAFCQIVRGRGVLRLPDGREHDYAGPELYVFRPHTLHEWDAVTEDTLLSVCLVPVPG